MGLPGPICTLSIWHWQLGWNKNLWDIFLASPNCLKNNLTLQKYVPSKLKSGIINRFAKFESALMARMSNGKTNPPSSGKKALPEGQKSRKMNPKIPLMCFH
jgi:hypothetical protein